LKRLFLLLVAALALLAPAVGQAASGPSLNFYAPNTTTPAITNFAYGPVLPGQSVSKTFTLKNTGGSATAALKITLAKTAGATGAFTKTGDTCSLPVPISLGKGKTCQITIRFAPVAGGESDAADLTAVSKKPNASKTLHLTGSGAAPNVQITPASKDFGTAAGTLQTFTATNNGTAASGTYAFASPGSPFFVVTFGPQANTCTGTALAIGASCSFTVVYAADVCSGNATYEKTAALGSLASVTVTATEPACPHITVSPTSHDFGTTSGTKQTFTFTNDGGAGRVMSTAFDPDNGVFEAPGAFACQSEILQTGESCSVEITLTLPEGCGASYSGFLRHGMATVGGSSGGNTATATFTAAQPACPPPPCVVTNLTNTATYDTLQAANAAATAGDELTLSGLCVERATLNKNLTVTGVGADPTLSGGGGGGFKSVLTVDHATVTVNSLTITGGNVITGIAGAGVDNQQGDVTLSGVTITGSKSGGGGAGIFNDGTMTLVDSVVSDSSTPGVGGAIWNYFNATLTLSGDTSITHNISGSEGGGIFNNPGASVTLNDTATMTDNTGTSGGGIYNQWGGAVTTLNDASSISGNSATNAAPSGGGIYNNTTPTGGGSAPIVNLNGGTVSGNTPDDCVNC
jgi:hypothetical protein